MWDPDELITALDRQGLHPQARPGTTQLIAKALARFHSRGPGGPTSALWVPGRLEVIGKHTDYAGGRSLVAPLSRGMIFLAKPRSDESIEVYDAQEEPAAVPSGYRRYVDAVVRRLSNNFPGAAAGATVVFASNLPRAAGMSSSSALLTGLAASLARVWRLESRREWLTNLADRRDLASYAACIENGATFRGLPGIGGVGTEGGSEDHAAIVLGRAGFLSEFAFAPLRHVRDVTMPDRWQFVIATSGIAASKSGAARGDYNRLSQGIAVLLTIWNEAAAPHASLASALDSNPAAGDRLRELIAGRAVAGWTADALERRLAHFEIEDALVPDAVAAIESVDAAALGAIAEASQHRAEILLGNQTPETIALTRYARACGAFAASSFGAGFGGAVWALVAPEHAEDFSRCWISTYRQHYPDAARRAQAFIASAGPPMTDLAT